MLGRGGVARWEAGAPAHWILPFAACGDPSGRKPVIEWFRGQMKEGLKVLLGPLKAETVSHRAKRPLKAGSGPQFTANKKTGTSLLQPQGTEFCQQPEEQKMDFPLVSRKEHSQLTP